VNIQVHLHTDIQLLLLIYMYNETCVGFKKSKHVMNVS